MRRTKMICTIGPSSSDPVTLRRLIAAGMNIARLNFSHGTHESHKRTFDAIREAAEAADANVAILMDLQGPKIRTGRLAGGQPVTLAEGAPIIVTTRAVEGTAECVTTEYEALPNDVKPRDRILMADGAMELVVESVSGQDVACRVVHGGTLGEHKGINLPGVAVSAPSLTEKDIEDIHFGLNIGVDYIALSFVRAARDLDDIKRVIREKGKATPVIAKIERPEAFDELDAIIEKSDAIMVARGDLGVEAPLTDVPQLQKRLIRACNKAGKPVITATQMLESMITSPSPTRAEVNDVANAIYDGTDAVMLSGETASGKFPVEAAECMANIAVKADIAVNQMLAHTSEGALTQAEAIGQAVAQMVKPLNIKRILCFTQSGYSARAIARYRPDAPITALTLSEATRRRCALYWGVDAARVIEVCSTDAMLSLADEVLLEENLADVGDNIIIVAGTPLAVGSVTNLLKLHTVGDKY